MTYNVFGGTLSLTQSINQPTTRRVGQMGRRVDPCSAVFNDHRTLLKRCRYNLLLWVACLFSSKFIIKLRKRKNTFKVMIQPTKPRCCEINVQHDLIIFFLNKVALSGPMSSRPLR